MRGTRHEGVARLQRRAADQATQALAPVVALSRILLRTLTNSRRRPALICCSLDSNQEAHCCHNAMYASCEDTSHTESRADSPGPFSSQWL